jgi:hypothetical protein
VAEAVEDALGAPVVFALADVVCCVPPELVAVALLLAPGEFEVLVTVPARA